MNAHAPLPPTTLPLGGFSLRCTTSAELKQLLQQAVAEHDQHALFFANTNFIVKCQPLQEKIRTTKNVIVNDGIGIDIAAWLVHRNKFPENLNGTDFVPAFLQSLGEQARPFFFGGKPGIAERAAANFTAASGIDVVGTCNGYEQARDAEKVVTAINAAGANVVLVAMGNPGQEQWILNHRDKIHAPVLIGVGALLDFLAGDKPRAPRVVQKLRLEWLYRLSLEPTRLLRRYTLDIGVFLNLCLKRAKEDARAHSTELADKPNP